MSVERKLSPCSLSEYEGVSNTCTLIISETRIHQRQVALTSRSHQCPAQRLKVCQFALSFLQVVDFVPGPCLLRRLHVHCDLRVASSRRCGELATLGHLAPVICGDVFSGKHYSLKNYSRVTLSYPIGLLQTPVSCITWIFGEAFLNACFGGVRLLFISQTPSKIE